MGAGLTSKLEFVGGGLWWIVQEAQVGGGVIREVVEEGLLVVAGKPKGEDLEDVLRQSNHLRAIVLQWSLEFFLGERVRPHIGALQEAACARVFCRHLGTNEEALDASSKFYGGIIEL